MGSALNSTYSNQVDVAGVAGGSADTVRESLPGALRVAEGLGPRGTELAANAQSAFVDGFHSSIWIGTAALVVSAVVLLAIGPRRSQVRLDLGDETPSEPAPTSLETSARRSLQRQHPNGRLLGHPAG